MTLSVVLSAVSAQVGTPDYCKLRDIVSGEDPGAVLRLLNAGATPNVPGNTGRTPPHERPLRHGANAKGETGMKFRIKTFWVVLATAVWMTPAPVGAASVPCKYWNTLSFFIGVNAAELARCLETRAPDAPKIASIGLEGLVRCGQTHL